MSDEQYNNYPPQLEFTDQLPAELFIYFYEAIFCSSFQIVGFRPNSVEEYFQVRKLETWPAMVIFQKKIKP